MIYASVKHDWSQVLCSKAHIDGGAFLTFERGSARPRVAFAMGHLLGLGLAFLGRCLAEKTELHRKLGVEHLHVLGGQPVK